MIKISASVFSFLVVLGFSSTSWATPAQVLIIRHAEKPASGPDLSPQGYQHAQELVSYFESNPEVTQYGRPFAIYAMANNSADSGLRPIETVTPLAHALRDLAFKTNTARTTLKPLPKKSFRIQPTMARWF